MTVFCPQIQIHLNPIFNVYISLGYIHANIRPYCTILTADGVPTHTLLASPPSRIRTLIRLKVEISSLKVEISSLKVKISSFKV